MTTQATVVAHSGNKKLRVTVQVYKDGEWINDTEVEIDPRLYGSTTQTMWDNRRLIVEEVDEFFN